MVTVILAQPSDAEFIWTIFGDTVARVKYAFIPGNMTWDSFLVWYNGHLLRDDSKFYVVKWLGESAGYLRITCSAAADDYEGAEISIALSEKHKGLGIGADAIALATSDFSRQFGCSIVAHVRKDNSRSQRAFLKAGYSYVRDLIIEGHDSVMLISKV